MAFVYDLTDTWNAGGTTFNAIKMNVTDTASAAASKLITVQVGGSEKFSVRKDGLTYVAGSLGVGTSSPSAKLEVSGSVRFVDSSAAGPDLLFGNIGGSTAINNVANARNYYGAFEHIFTNFDNSAERMRITSAGLVGVGTTAPSDALQVSRSATSTGTGIVAPIGLTLQNTSSTAGNYTTIQNRDANGSQNAQIQFINVTHGAPYQGAIAFSARASSGDFAERMRITSAGLVGIGTSSPDKALTISASDSQIRLYDADGTNQFASIQSDNGTTKITSRDNTSNGTIAFQRFDGTTVSESMRIDSSGRVGIATSNPGANLHVVGDGTIVRLQQASGGTFGGLMEIRNAAGARRGYVGFTSTSGTTLGLNNDEAGPLTFGTSNTERMRIDSSGRVGVGTASPQYIVHAESTNPRIVSKGTSATSYASFESRNDLNNSLVAIGRGSTETGTILGQANANGAQIYSVNYGYLAVGTFTSAPLILGTNNTERMRITSAGLVGVGVTDPAGLLEVFDVLTVPARNTTTIAGQRGLSVYNNQSNGSVDTTLVYGAAASSYFAIGHHNGTSYSERMRIDSSGYLLVNRTSRSSSVSGVRVETEGRYGSTVTGTAGYSFGTTGSSFTINDYSNGTTETERMRIDSSGRVGVGTSSPDSKLDIEAANSQLRLTDSDDSKFAEFSYSSGKLIVRNNSTSTSTEQFTLDGSGRMGIGTISPTGKMTVETGAGDGLNLYRAAANANFAAITFKDTANSGTNAKIGWNSNELRLEGTSVVSSHTGGSERARIDASGNFLVGTTTTSGAGLVVYPSLENGGFLQIRKTSSAASGNRFSNFIVGTTEVGSISYNGSGTAYNTSSDYRLKDIDGPIANSGAYIDALKPVQGSWKADGSRFVGLLAHEVQEVSETQIATGEKDGEEMQAMDYSAPEIIANLIAEIQSLRARVAQLEGN